ncbi:5928_t:CDS:2, partial [Funneliformis geosporum]
HIDDINAIIHWLMPEKLKSISENQDSKTNKTKSYTIQYDIFSFVMLLWELGFQKTPYKGMSISVIQKHVLKGNRERFGSEACSDPIQKAYYKAIKFENLSEDLQNHKSINKVIPLTPFKEGLVAHKKQDYAKAWKCFEEHANVGDTAIEIFKEAADNGNGDAQLRYAFCLIDKGNENNNHNGIQKDQNKGVQYLKLAALKDQQKVIDILKRYKISLFDSNHKEKISMKILNYSP